MSLETQYCKKDNLQNTLSKSFPTMCTIVGDLSNCYDYFLRETIETFLEKKFCESNLNKVNFVKTQRDYNGDNTLQP